MKRCIGELIAIEFKAQGLVADNHGAIVVVFALLLQENYGDLFKYFIHPSADFKTYVWFSPVHLLKNVRKNLLNRKKFVFPGFDFDL